MSGSWSLVGSKSCGGQLRCKDSETCCLGTEWYCSTSQRCLSEPIIRPTPYEYGIYAAIGWLAFTVLIVVWGIYKCRRSYEGGELRGNMPIPLRVRTTRSTDQAAAHQCPVGRIGNDSRELGHVRSSYRFPSEDRFSYEETTHPSPSTSMQLLVDEQ